MIIVLVGRVNTHHCEGLTWTCLAISEYRAIIPFKTIYSASLTNFLKHIILSVVITNGVKCKLFTFAAIKSLNRMCLFFNINTYPIILLLLSFLIKEKVLLTKWTNTNCHLDWLFILWHFSCFFINLNLNQLIKMTLFKSSAVNAFFYHVKNNDT